MARRTRARGNRRAFFQWLTDRSILHTQQEANADDSSARGYDDNVMQRFVSSIGNMEGSFSLTHIQHVCAIAHFDPKKYNNIFLLLFVNFLVQKFCKYLYSRWKYEKTPSKANRICFSNLQNFLVLPKPQYTNNTVMRIWQLENEKPNSSHYLLSGITRGGGFMWISVKNLKICNG